MATYYVTHVRMATVKNAKGNSTHEHITGVFTRDGILHPNQEVVDSINDDRTTNEWYTDVAGAPKAKIRPLGRCPQETCDHKPYLRTEADRSAKNNLENLPRR